MTPVSLFQQNKLTARRWIPSLDSALTGWDSKINRGLDVEKRARDAGRQNLPSHDDIELDRVQQEIVARFQHGSDSLSQALAGQIDGACQSVEDRRARHFNASAPAEKAKLEAEALRSREMESLCGAADREREAWRDLEHFKSEHKLERNAEYPDTIALPVFWLLLVTLIETAVNAFVFAEASEHGYIGGIAQAGIFSVLNVGVAAGFVGFLCLRAIEHRSVWRKVLGFLGAGIGLLFAITWNAGVAHFRELIAANPDLLSTSDLLTGGADILTRIKIDPFGIHSMQGWALFVLGLVAAGFAAWKGFVGFDDRYPGFGKRDRALRRAQDVYAKAKNEHKDAVAAIFHAERDWLKARSASDERVAQETSEIVAQARQRGREYRDSCLDLSRACKSLLRKYRETNSRVRDPFSPPPTYFSVYPECVVHLPDFKILDAAVEDTLQSLHMSAVTTLQARKALAEAEKQFVAEFDAFFRHVEQEAARRRRSVRDPADGKMREGVEITLATMLHAS